MWVVKVAVAHKTQVILALKALDDTKISSKPIGGNEDPWVRSHFVVFFWMPGRAPWQRDGEPRNPLEDGPAQAAPFSRTPRRYECP